ncbi:MAG: sulfurtransferase [Flavobacteriaceae bacterium]|nr:sulfurtransferase [Flavobacteriaceae bacterium]
MKINSSLVSVDWLHINLDINPNLIVLDGSIKKVTDSSNELSNLQIPNARFFDIKNKFSDVDAKFPNTVPSEAQFTQEAQNLGINNESYIVVYDDKGIYSSARVWWLFKSFGFDNVTVLDGGLPEWIASGYQTKTKTGKQIKKGNFQAIYNPQYFNFFTDIQQFKDDSSCLILDARNASRFNGEIEEPRIGLRSGHIPNSKSLPYTTLFNGNILKSKSKLKQIFNTLINEEKKLIFSCGSGVTACVLALAAELSEIKNVSVYDGSWTEYGSLTT